MPDTDSDRVTRAWPALAGQGATLLPDPGTDLGPFLRAIIPGEPAPGWAGRDRDLIAHFRNLEPEFRGKPRLAHLLACTIAGLRRTPGDAAAAALFHRILAEHGPALPGMLNSRWLVAVCDTVIDIGENDLDRSLALTGTLFVTTLKMAETELRLYRPERPWPPRRRLRHGGEIHDGIITFWTGSRGDLDNLLARIERGLRLPSVMAPLVAALVERAFDGPTVLNRMARLSGTPQLPLAPGDRVAALRDLMRDL